ncbi:MAG: hypothetical protein RI885_1714 [Actinomycetota bacterium]
MTAWHNQPPLSRRQARDSARLHGGEPESGSIPVTEVVEESMPAPSVTAGSGRRVQWDPSAQPAEPLTYRTRSGLTAEEIAAEFAADDDDVAAPPTAATAGSDELASAVTGPVSARPASEALAAEVSMVPDQDAAGDAAGEGAPADAVYRLRDYRPERRSSFAPLSSEPAGSWSPPAMDGASPGPDAVSEPGHAGANDPISPDRTMTRRELRLLRERAAADGEPEPSVVFGHDGAATTTSAISVPSMPVDDPVTAGAASPEGASADVAPPDAGTANVGTVDAASPDHEVIEAELVDDVIPELIEPTSDRWADPVVVEPVAPSPFAASSSPWSWSSTPGPGSSGQSSPAPAEANRPDSVEAIIAEPVTDSAPLEQIVVEPMVVETMVVDAVVVDPIAEQSMAEHPIVTDPVVADAVASQPIAPQPAAPVVVPPPVVTSAPSSTPYGHWSTQSDIDDRATTAETALSRNVGVSTGAITTHALVLPSIPESGDQLLAPLTTSTGEIIVTGSIDLPRSFGSTGVHPTMFDHPDVDAIIDDSDRDDAGAESAPVRAVRAVASNSSARAVIEAPAPRKSRLPLILGIVGGAALLVAIGVIVTVFVINGV